MNYLWKCIRNLAAVVGFACIYLGISTCDYYLMELGESEPHQAWGMVIVGFVLMVPTIIHLIVKECKQHHE